MKLANITLGVCGNFARTIPVELSTVSVAVVAAEASAAEALLSSAAKKMCIRDSSYREQNAAPAAPRP